MVSDYFGCCFLFSGLLNSVATDIIKVFATSKPFEILTRINLNLSCIKDCGLL